MAAAAAAAAEDDDDDDYAQRHFSYHMQIVSCACAVAILKLWDHSAVHLFSLQLFSFLFSFFFFFRIYKQVEDN